MEKKTVSFSRILKPREYYLVTAIFAVLAVFAVWAFLREDDVILAIATGAICLVLTAIFLVTALLRVNVSAHGVSLSLCGITLKKICASDLRTIVKTRTTNGRWPLKALAVFSAPAEEMEANGEQRLRKKAILKEELKFREGRSDWSDVCMGVGFYREPFRKGESPLGRWKSGIWLEFSPEREELLRRTFPQAEYRVPKRYSDPLSTK